MNTDIARQAAALAAAFAGGIVLGLMYDILRFLRRHLRVGGAADVFFCMIAGAAAFIYAMGPGDGKLDIWGVLLALLGAAAYLRVIGDSGQKILYKLSFPLRVVLRRVRKSKKFLKNAISVFQNQIKCYIIKLENEGVSETEGSENENGGSVHAETYAVHHQNSGSYSAYIRNGVPVLGTEHAGADEQTDNRSRRRARSARKRKRSAGFEN